MKNEDKTIALTLLALIVYALFVWHGMSFESSVSTPLSTAFESITGNTMSAPVHAVYNESGSGPSVYLKTLGLTVYTDAEFTSIGGGGRIFSTKPQMTLFVYMPTPQGDAIVWHDGHEGYV